MVWISHHFRQWQFPEWAVFKGFDYDITKLGLALKESIPSSEFVDYLRLA